ncbi:MAG: sulfite exporter TauE/SafE family protein [Clostridia bacterium]|nr:sulfite exporter TauE/SafE family protein [Clostridia bacterium]
MEQNIEKKVLHIEGMTCASCENRIENELKKLNGLMEAKASYTHSYVCVTYGVDTLGLDKIIESIEKLDYKVEGESSHSEKENENKMTSGQLVGIGIILFAFYMIINNTIGFNFIPEVEQSMNYGVLLVIGLFTSLHCIAMCGGINLSVCMKYGQQEDMSSFGKLKPSALYNMGRVISYTVIGGIVGALGAAVAFTGTAKGVVAIISGVFMVVMGMNMLSIFPWLRKLNPRLPKGLSKKIHSSTGKKGPFIVGILNGLMPCGPLQAMQLYALGTGSFAAGALSMFLFSLGTVPLMFGFGAVSSFLSGKFTQKMMKASAILVMILGIMMLNRGLNLSGYKLSFAVPEVSANTVNIAKIEGNVQTVTTKMESGRYSPIIVQKGIPVRWTIKAEKNDLNGCNNPVTIPLFDIKRKLVPGDNIIEFTPTEEGSIVYTCWMGMISSHIKVVNDISTADVDVIDDAGGLMPSGGGCGMGCCGG